MNIIEINERIKQRPPFQMIERVLHLEEGKKAIGVKCVSVNEPYFQGHFPDAPVMPGVLLIEAAAQLCSLVVPQNEADSDKLYMLLRVKDFKLLRPVIPGDRLELETEVSMSSGVAYEFNVKISCDGQLKAKGVLLFTAVDKSAVYG